MKPLTAEEKQSTLASFLDVDDSASLTVLDRSTLERYCTCPAQARFLETGAVVDRAEILSVGQESHDALSHATAAWLDSRGQMSPSELASELEMYMRSARPDLQPDVISALRRMVWDWSRYMTSRNHKDILRFDGGKGDQSGQLARDLDGLSLRITSEIDLLHAGPSPVVLHEIDYKSCWKRHGVQDVRDSFQFQLHWWLVAHNYPDCEALQVQVWDTRVNRRTWAVEFTQDALPAIAARINSAAGEWWQHRSSLPADVPTWPTKEKCAQCAAACLCPSWAQPTDGTPEQKVDWLVAADARVTAITKELSAERKRRGQDIVTDAGNAFGIGKPKKPRAPTAGLYSISQEEPEEAEAQ